MPGRSRPIYSSKENEPALEDEISDFVVGLAERVDCLQDAESTGDLKELAALAEQLAALADRLGYAPLVEAARDVSSASKREDEDGVQEALVELTEISYLVRRGHRGAA